MANNKKKTLNNVKSELSKKKRGNPNFVKKQNEIIKEVEENKEEVIETISSDQIVNDNNEVNENNEVSNNILITDDDYGNNNNTNENLDTINTSQETNNKKVKKNTSLYELLSRPSGATMEELEKELNWKKASIRGTISNLQKEQQFCLITINVIKPNLDDKSFYKETRYFIKDCEFNLFNDLLNNLPNPEMASIPAC